MPCRALIFAEINILLYNYRNYKNRGGQAVDLLC